MSIRFWLEKNEETVECCPTCGKESIRVPYGGHPLSRLWNRVANGEMLKCCPDMCLDSEEYKPRRIYRGGWKKC